MTWYLTKADVIGEALSVLSVLLVAIAVYLIGISFSVYIDLHILGTSCPQKQTAI